MGIGNLSRKAVTMIYEQKRRIIFHWEYQRKHVDSKFTLMNLSKWTKNEFNLSNLLAKNTLSDLFSKNHDRFLIIFAQDQQIRQARVVICSQIEEALVLGVLQMKQKKINLSRTQIKEKGRRFLVQFDFEENYLQFSDHWMNQFIKCNEFRAYRSYGESGFADLNNVDVQAKIAEIKGELSNYALRDQYNMNETTLFYHISSDITIARQAIESHKKNKTQITIAFTYNADGTDGFKSLFIGRAVKPHCFNKRTGKELGFLYFYNKKAWMMSMLYQISH